MLIARGLQSCKMLFALVKPKPMLYIPKYQLPTVVSYIICQHLVITSDFLDLQSISQDTSTIFL